MLYNFIHLTFPPWHSSLLYAKFTMRKSIAALFACHLAAADYTGQYRPQAHFSPPSGFMNDPNGLFRDGNGVWHLYYQYNPTDIVGGNQHWGHATSPDLYHWTNYDPVLAPTPELGAMFTGSAIVDVNNTSGFFPGQSNGVVAVYTAATPNGQKQALAYSKDSGYTFTQYSGNPVLSYSSPDFRDPKVFWHEATQKWVMVVAFSDESAVGFYTSPNLKDWTLGSRFAYTGQGGGATECPNITPIPFIPEGASSADHTVWLLYISQGGGNPLGGTMSQYYVGNFDGTTFHAFGDVREVEFGMDNYAAQFWNTATLPKDWRKTGIAGIGWASNGLYANSLPSGQTEGWRSSNTAPRRYYITNSTALQQDFALVSQPWSIDTVKGQQLGTSQSLGNSVLTAKSTGDASSAGTFFIEADVAGLNSGSTGATLKFTISSSTTGESLTATQTFDGGNQFVMDRSNTRGFNDTDFTSPKPTIELATITSYKVQLLVDRSIWEAFVMDGLRVATELFYTSEPSELDTVTITSNGFGQDATVSATVWNLKSTWAT